MRQSAKAILIGAAAIAAFATTPAQAQLAPYMGQIRSFGMNFCPQGWAPAAGQILQIQQNPELFSLLGARYGGDGATTFALPDLRGRVVVGRGQGPGLSAYTDGQTGGAEMVTLDPTQLPSHAHAVPELGAPPSALVRRTAKGGIALARSTTAGATQSTQSVGGGQAHENRQPSLAVTTCIAVQGIVPLQP